MARSGLQVRDAISPAPLTAPSHATLLTGRNPPRHGIRENGGFVLAEGVLTVAQRLPGDVRSAAFVAAAPLLAGAGLERGFALYDDDLDGMDPLGRPRSERPVGEVLARAGAWLDDRRAGEPVFAWIHLFDAHYPWEAPSPWPLVMSSGAAPVTGAPARPDTAWEGAAAAHAAEIAALDQALGRFLRDIGRPAMVVVTSDHGESLGAHSEITHGFFTYDVTQRVPLLVSGSGVVPGLDPRTRSLAAVAPFFLERFGVAADAEDPPSLDDPSVEPLVLYLESRHPEILYGLSPVFAARTDHWKYIDLPRRELYELTVDPGEAHNRIDVESEVADGLQRWLDAERARDRSLAGGALDPDQAERLRALGYVAASGPARTGDRTEEDPKDVIDAVMLVFSGLHALRSGDATWAVDALEAADRLRPGQRETRHHLARARLALGDPEGAAREARRALELRPPTSEVELRALLGEALTAQGRPAEALPHLELAARARPGDPRVQNLLEAARRELR
jgi:hypothetical protein